MTVVIDLALLWTLWPSISRGKVTRIFWVVRLWMAARIRVNLAEESGELT